MGRVREDRLVGAGEVLEEREQGVKDEGNRSSADADESGARKGDNVVEGEVLGGRARSVWKLYKFPWSAAIESPRQAKGDGRTLVVRRSTRAPTRTPASPFMARRDWFEGPPFIVLWRWRRRGQQQAGAFS